jgi:hypothetical protein
MSKTYSITILADSGAACSNSRMQWDARAQQSRARKAAAAAAANRDRKAYRESDSDDVAFLLTLHPTD